MTKFKTEYLRANQKSIADLIGFTLERTYQLAHNQRNYDWTEKETERLLKDLFKKFDKAYDKEKAIKSLDAYFIGMIVLVEDEDDGSKDKKPCDILDGQQRITTLLLILSSLYYVLGSKPEFEKSNLKNRIAQCINPPAGRGSRTDQKRLKVDQRWESAWKKLTFTDDWNSLKDNIDELMNEASKKPKNKKNSDINMIKNTEKIINFFKEREITFEDAENFFYFLLNGVIYIEISTTKGPHSYQVYEAINSTGLALNQADLIKNMLFSHIEGKTPENLEKQWADMENKIKECGHEVSKFLHWSAISHVKQPDNIIKFEKLCEFLAEHLSESNNIPDQLIKRTTVDIELMDDAVIPFEILNIEFSKPMALSCLRAEKDGRLKNSQVVFRLIESFIFRYMKVSKGKSGTLARVAHEVCTVLNTKDEASALIEIKAIFKRESDDDEFIKELSNYSEQNPKVAYYVQQKIQDALTQKSSYVAPRHSLSYHLEHIMPKSPGQYWQTEADAKRENANKYSSDINLIGNHIILESSVNKEIQNYEYAKKLKEYEKVLSKEVLDTVKESEINAGWSIESIGERTRRLSDLVKKHKIWSLD